ncbi:hypothetical protein PFISCL1PPCAC_7923, partial [Pristionchus fissidentatus]
LFCSLHSTASVDHCRLHHARSLWCVLHDVVLRLAVIALLIRQNRLPQPVKVRTQFLIEDEALQECLADVVGDGGGRVHRRLLVEDSHFGLCIVHSWEGIGCAAGEDLPQK